MIGKTRQHQAIFPNDIHPAVRPQIHGGEPGVDLLHAQHAHHHAIEHPIFTAYGTGNRQYIFAHAQFFGGLANKNARKLVNPKRLKEIMGHKLLAHTLHAQRTVYDPPLVIQDQ